MKMSKNQLNQKGLEIIELKSSYDNSNTTTKNLILKELINYNFSEKEIQQFKKDSIEQFSKSIISDEKFIKKEKDYMDEFANEIITDLDNKSIKVTAVTTDDNLIILKKIGLSRMDLLKIGIKDKNDLFIKNFLDKIVKNSINKVLENYKNKKVLKNLYMSDVYNSKKFSNLYNIDITITLKKTEIFKRKKENLVKEIISVIKSIEEKNEELLNLFDRSVINE